MIEYIKTGERSYVGATFGTYEQNLAHDSYFYAVVWDGGRVKSVMVDTTAYYHTPTKVTIDVTDDVYRMAASDLSEDLALSLSRDIRVGSEVESTVTRGKNRGHRGTVDKIIKSKYQSAWAARYQPEYVALVGGRWIPTTSLRRTGDLVSEAARVIRAQGVVSVHRRLSSS